MALRFPLPVSDGRIHKEEDITYMRMASQRNSNRAGPSDNTFTPPIDPKQEVILETTPLPAPNRRHLVFADPVAFRFLQDDTCVSVVERKGKLCGYELYLVEQWACSRQSPTLVIVTYTGDETHHVVVSVLSVPEDESAWSPRLRFYFKAIQQYHARPKVTPLGELMVTNLSSFPSALTVISVPDGDIKEHRQEFIVNENLKRLGCSGRSAMNLAEPTGAAKAKFSQLYKTSEKVAFSEAVVELIKLCQVALFIFGKLEQEYIDGLLCDVTETAVGNWWIEFGSEYYNVEPTDGILGPTTVVALLGLLMGARNRLSYYGAPIAKDVFDIDATKRGISYFQKSQKLERTRRLDRQTLHKLHGVTAKAAAGEGWGVQKAVKSTVTEIGGKRGEIVLGMVGGRDKGGIGDIETLDLDKFISLAHGERAKWLWFGKPRRTTTDHSDRSVPDMPNILFGKDELPMQSKRSQSIPLEEELEVKKKDSSLGVYATTAPGSATSVAADSPSERDALRKGVFKSVAGKMSDARSGLGRIKDAVYSGGGLRGHVGRPSRDESSETAYSGTNPSILSGSSAGLVASPGTATVGRVFTWKTKPGEYRDAFKKDTDYSSTVPEPGLVNQELPPMDLRPIGQAVDETAGGSDNSVGHNLPKPDTAVADTTHAEVEQRDTLVMPGRRYDQSLLHLHRRHSVAGMQPDGHSLNENRWPRRLSFGDAEEAVLGWTEITGLDDEELPEAANPGDKKVQLIELARTLYMSILDVKQTVEPWVDSKIKSVEALDNHYTQQQEELQALYHQLADIYQQTKSHSRELIASERATVTEAVKDVEVLVAKLEYEINALVSRVQDVEDGVAQFEGQVEAVERRAEELKTQLETESWLHWAVRTLTGIGTGPNITRVDAPGEVRQQQQQQQQS